MRKRKAETLMEFLISMAVAGMLFIMISTALQRSTSSVARIYTQDVLQAAGKKYIAGLPDELGTKDKSTLETVMTKRVSPDVADFMIENENFNSNLLTFDLKIKSHDETYTIRNITHFFN